MALGSKILAALAVLVGSVLSIFIFVHPPLRSMYWDAAGENVLNASIGLVVIFASVIAVGNWLWTRDW